MAKAIGTETATRETAAVAIYSGVTELIISSPLLGIGKNFIGFRKLLEFFFRFLVPRIFIRMILKRQLTISFFYFQFRGIAMNLQHLIIITLQVIFPPPSITMPPDGQQTKRGHRSCARFPDRHDLWPLFTPYLLSSFTSSKSASTTSSSPDSAVSPPWVA